MTDPTDAAAPLRWNAGPTAKARMAAQRSVTELLDQLAPERVLKHVAEVRGAVEQHRTPTGCVLQAADCAVSVSWFAVDEDVLGELHVLVWRGKVARRGTARPAKGATIVADLVLRPIVPPTDEYVWQATDGSRYDTAGLVAKCLALLETQIAAG